MHPRLAHSYVCKLYKTVAEGGEWHRYVIHGEWTRETAGGCPNFDTCCKNTQYYIKPKARCTVAIQLQQSDPRKLGGADAVPPAIGAKLVYKKNGNRVRRLYNGETVLSSRYVNAREVSVWLAACVALASLLLTSLASLHVMLANRALLRAGTNTDVTGGRADTAPQSLRAAGNLVTPPVPRLHGI